ncbi:MAG: 2-methylisocitrate lyase [Fimbriimonadaceae bacterium]|nr:2-methylisocitrate lyase [Fimbriimonadaceae bacterium]
MAQGTVMMPGVFNAITAISATRAGARALYVTGAGVTNATLGVPDIALISPTEMATVCSNVCSVTPLPVIADADTAYGEAWNAARTVMEMERAGLAGIHIEDQISPKRCGHLEGKELVPTSQMVAKIRATASAKRDSTFMIIARTDARGVEGLEAAIERAKRYVGEGADAIFPEGLESEGEFETFRKGVDAPLLANMTEFGKTPIIPLSRFSEMGYEMIIFPMTAFRCMLKAVDECYGELIRTGTQAHFLDKMRTRQELYDLIEYPKYTAMDMAWSKGLED